MQYVAVPLVTATAVAVGGFAFVAVPRLLSTESTSTVGSIGRPLREEGRLSCSRIESAHGQEPRREADP